MLACWFLGFLIRHVLSCLFVCFTRCVFINQSTFSSYILSSVCTDGSCCCYCFWFRVFFFCISFSIKWKHQQQIDWLSLWFLYCCCLCSVTYIFIVIFTQFYVSYCIQIFVCLFYCCCYYYWMSSQLHKAAVSAVKFIFFTVFWIH